MPYHATHHLKSLIVTLFDLCFLDNQTKLIDYGQYDVSFLLAHNFIHITYNIQRETERISSRHSECRDFRSFVKSEFLTSIIGLN